jgi:hypothetical protein
MAYAQRAFRGDTMKAMYAGDLVKKIGQSKNRFGIILETAPLVNMIRVHWFSKSCYGWHEDKNLEVVYECG